MSVLVAFDFSPPSRRALQEAAAIAEGRDAPLLVVHAFGRTPIVPPGGKADPIARLYIEGNLEEAQRLTDEVLAPLRARGLDVALMAEEGSAKAVLEKALDQARPGLVVVGHHSTGIHLGSVAKWLLDHAGVPVLVVPE